jgi:hypothetical protein
MKPKTVEIDGKKYIVADDSGAPIYVHDDGTERPFDAIGTTSRIGGLNREAQTHREEKEAALGKLKLFEGLDDPEAARNALKTVGNLKAGDLKTAEQVEEIRTQARKAAEEQVQQTAAQSANEIKQLKEQLEGSQKALYGEKVGGAFGRSTYIKDRLTVPPDLLMNTFGSNFKIEDGKMVPYDSNGQKIWSKTNPGEVAGFEEGIEHLVNNYQGKSHILKGTGHSGSGAGHGGGGQGGQGGQQGGKPTMSRAAFEKLSPMEKGPAIAKHTIVDDAA